MAVRIELPENIEHPWQKRFAPTRRLSTRRSGSREAERRKLRVIGTVRVLDDAAEAGLVDLPTTLQRTIELDIHSHSALVCPRRLLGSSPNTFWGQVSFK